MKLLSFKRTLGTGFSKIISKIYILKFNPIYWNSNKITYNVGFTAAVLITSSLLVPTVE